MKEETPTGRSWFGRAEGRDPTEGFDLLRVGPVRGLVLGRGFPYAVQALALAGFVALAVLSWGHFTPAGTGAKLYAKVHLATLVVWGLWWPAMVWGAVLLGRAWCALCPLELASNGAERAGRRLGVPRRALPRGLAAGWAILAVYALVQMLVAGVSLHRVPAWTSVFLITLLVVAGATGLLLKDRAFCRGFCPVGLLLGTYGRGGMIAVRAGSAEACQACAGKDCVRSCHRARLDARSCPSLLNPPRLDSNRDCLVCGQCLKACAPDNLRLLLRAPFAASDAREPLASWPVTLFVMVASGFVLGELFTEWPAADEGFFLAVPSRLAAGLEGPWAGWIEGLWTLVVIPLAAWSLLGLLARRLGPPRPLAAIWRRMALPVAVVVAAGHMGKGLAKLVSWAPFLPGAWADPSGVATATAIAARTTPSPASLLALPVVGTISLGLVAAGLAYALRELRLAHPGERLGPGDVLPPVAVAAAWAAVIGGWVVQ
jgi:hypothetical protein